MLEELVMKGELLRERDISSPEMQCSECLRFLDLNELQVHEVEITKRRSQDIVVVTDEA